MLCGMTHLNVYAGPAGFYIVRGGPDGDDSVLDSRFGTPSVLPGPAHHENDQFPSNKTYYEIPIAIQDRSFNADGSLFYPDTRALFDGMATADNPGYLPALTFFADLESRVLWKRNDGEWQYLALPDSRASDATVCVS